VRRLCMPQTGLAAPQPGRSPRAVGGLRRVRDRAVLGLHRLIERLDLAPPELGAEPLADAEAVRSEWKRYLRLWAGHEPEEVFALKISGALLLAGMVAVGLAFAIMR
jgi:hypothetical protein